MQNKVYNKNDKGFNITKLWKLKEEGYISDEEFEALKTLKALHEARRKFNTNNVQAKIKIQSFK